MIIARHTPLTSCATTVLLARAHSSGSKLWGTLWDGIRTQRYRSTAVAMAPGGNPVAKVVIRTERAPAPLNGAPYNQAIKANGMVFVSGQIALDPTTGKLIDGNVEAQAEMCLKNMAAILEEAGSSMDSVVKTTVLLADIGDFGAVNAVYSKFFSVEPPARAAFAVKDLPGGALVEIDCIAVSAS